MCSTDGKFFNFHNMPISNPLVAEEKDIVCTLSDKRLIGLAIGYSLMAIG